MEVYGLKVMVAVPCCGAPEPLTMETLFRVARRCRRWCDLELVMPRGYSCDMARNEAVRRFMESDAQWLWFVDSDIALPEDALERLLKAGCDVVSGVYFRKIPGETRVAEVCRLDGEETVFYREDELPSGLFDAAGVGAGCLLIRRSVIERALGATGGARLFVYQHEPELISEDLWFCNIMRQLGCSITVDGDLRLGHIGTVIY